MTGTEVGETDVGNGGPKKRSKLRARKVAPKFRNPKMGHTWSGRGAMAGWLKAEVKAGKEKDSYLIAAKRKAKR